MRGTDENGAARLTDRSADIRAARLARRAWWSVIFGVASFVPLVFFVVYFNVYTEWAVFRGFGGLGDYLSILVRLGSALLLAALAIGAGLTAASRDNTSSRPLALIGLIIGGLSLDGLVSYYFWLLDSLGDLIRWREGLVRFGLIAGVLIWATVVIDARAGWIRLLRENPQERFYDEALEHRLLRRAQCSVVLGILALIIACLPFEVGFLEENIASHFWYILHYFGNEFVVGVTFVSMGLGFLAGILASTACQRRGMSGNSLAWTGIVFGIAAVGVSVCAGWTVYL